MSNMFLLIWSCFSVLQIIYYSIVAVAQSETIQDDLITAHYSFCDFHVTTENITVANDFLEIYLMQRQYYQPWTVYTHHKRKESVSKENNFLSALKEVCDLNTLIFHSYNHTSTTHTTPILTSFRGFRQTSAFLLIFPTVEFSFDQFQDALSVSSTFNAKIYVTALAREYNSDLRTYTSSYADNQPVLLTETGRSDGISWRRHRNQGFGKKLLISIEGEIDLKCVTSVYETIKEGHSCTSSSMFYSALAKYKNITLTNLEGMLHQAKLQRFHSIFENRNVCGLLENINGIIYGWKGRFGSSFKRHVTFDVRKKVSFKQPTVMLPYYCKEPNDIQQVSALIWLEYGFDKPSWLLIVFAYVCVTLYLYLLNESVHRKGEGFSWITTFSVFFNQNDRVSNMVILLYTFFAFTTLAIYECFVTSESIIPPIKESIANFSELTKQGYKVPLPGGRFSKLENLSLLTPSEYSILKPLLTVPFNRVRTLSKSRLVYEFDESNTDITALSNAKIKSKNEFERTKITMRFLNGEFSLEKKKPKFFSVITGDGSKKNIIEASANCKAVDKPHTESNVITTFSYCFGEILQNGMRTLIEIGILDTFNKMEQFRIFHYFKVEYAREKYLQNLPISSPLGGRVQTTFYILLTFICIAFVIFTVELVFPKILSYLGKIGRLMVTMHDWYLLWSYLRKRKMFDVRKSVTVIQIKP